MWRTCLCMTSYQLPAPSRAHVPRRSESRAPAVDTTCFTSQATHPRHWRQRDIFLAPLNLGRLCLHRSQCKSRAKASSAKENVHGGQKAVYLGVSASESSTTDNAEKIKNRHEYQIQTHSKRVPVEQKATLSRFFWTRLCGSEVQRDDMLCVATFTFFFATPWLICQLKLSRYAEEDKHCTHLNATWRNRVKPAKTSKMEVVDPNQ